MSTGKCHLDDRLFDNPEDVSATGQNQLVTFRVGGSNYALSILCVREVRAWSPITPLPNAAEHIAGILNLRGSIIPIVDAQFLFGHGKTHPTVSHMIIIIMAQGRIQGLLVDTVLDIISVAGDDIRPLPTMVGELGRVPFDGLVVREDAVIVLLSAERLLTSPAGAGQANAAAIGSAD